MLEFLTWISVIIISLQAIYWILILTGLKLKDQPTTLANLPPVSIIVCAHDEEKNLRELIPQLLAQNHPCFEVIIVDDQSNDGTWDLLIEATKYHERLRMVKVTHKPAHIPGKKFALTLGIKSAQYDIVLLTDADCRPASNSWASSIASRFDEQTDLVLGISPYFKMQGWLNLLIRFESFVTLLLYTSFAKLGRPYMGVGRNLAYRKKIFFEGKGFNAHLSVVGGDDDLFVNQHARKHNTKVALENSALVYSFPKISFQDFFKQKIRHLAAGKQYRFSDQLMLAPMMISQYLMIPALIYLLATGLAVTAFLLLILRWALIVITFQVLNRKSETEYSLLLIPPIDIIFLFYYLAVAPVALFTQKIVWKT